MPYSGMVVSRAARLWNPCILYGRPRSIADSRDGDRVKAEPKREVRWSLGGQEQSLAL